MYNGLLAFRLRQYYKEHEHYMSGHAPYESLTEALNIGQFDRAVVCNVFGCVPCLLNQINPYKCTGFCRPSLDAPLSASACACSRIDELLPGTLVVCLRPGKSCRCDVLGLQGATEAACILLMPCRYTDTEQYYTDGSSEGYMPLIRTPTLYLASQDDPFVGRLPIAECSANPNTVLAVTSRYSVQSVEFLHALCAPW